VALSFGVSFILAILLEREMGWSSGTVVSAIQCDFLAESKISTDDRLTEIEYLPSRHSH